MLTTNPPTNVWDAPLTVSETDKLSLSPAQRATAWRAVGRAAPLSAVGTTNVALAVLHRKVGVDYIDARNWWSLIIHQLYSHIGWGREANRGVTSTGEWFVTAASAALGETGDIDGDFDGNVGKRRVLIPTADTAAATWVASGGAGFGSTCGPSWRGGRARPDAVGGGGETRSADGAVCAPVRMDIHFKKMELVTRPPPPLRAWGLCRLPAHPRCDGRASRLW